MPTPTPRFLAAVFALAVALTVPIPTARGGDKSSGSRRSATVPVEERVVELVNRERRAHGRLPPLRRSALLDAVSRAHSVRMGERDFFAHCDLDTRTRSWDRVREAGYAAATAAENIAAGQATPEEVVATWMASPGHRSNILLPDVTEVGVGYAFDADDAADVRVDRNGDCKAEKAAGPFRHYWTLSLGRPLAPAR